VKLLVVGARGNLGSALSRNSAHEIVPVGRSDWEGLRADRLTGIDAVVHVASELRVPVTDRPVAVVDSEIMVTARLLELMRANNLKRLVYVSSCAVYGNLADTAETAPCHPVTVNGRMKLLNEQIIAGFCAAHGIEATVGRVFNMFGGNDHFSIVARILSSVRGGSPLPVFHGGEGIRDFIHVDDVARILLAIIERKPSFPIINIGTGVGTRIADLVKIASEKIGALQIVDVGSRAEVSHSIANTERLRSWLGPQTFEPVGEYLRKQLQAVHAAS
jgi:UDP-glucose 4-epimerase